MRAAWRLGGLGGAAAWLGRESGSRLAPAGARQAGSRPDNVSSPPVPEFIALLLVSAPAPAVQDIHIELRRGATTVSVTWPGQAAGECATWLREWLR